MKSFLGLSLLLFSLPALGAFPGHNDIRDELDLSPVGARVQLGTQLQEKKIQALRGKWSYAVQGGAIGNHELLDVDGKPAQLPKGAIIVDCLLDVITAPNTSGLNTTSISFSTGIMGADLKGEAGFTSAYTPSGLKACTPVGSAATAIKLPTVSENYTPSIRISTLAVVAGEINVWIYYILSR